MTKILVVDGSGDLWGSERALLDMLDAMSSVSTAVCCPPGRPLLGELSKRQIPVFPYFIYRLHEKSRLHRLWAAVGVMRACAEFRPDAIYLNQSGAYRIVLMASWLLRLPIVAHVRLFEDVTYLARQNPKPQRLRALIAISRAIRAEIDGFAQLARIPVHLIYDGFAPTPQWGSATVQRPPDRIACVGRLGRGKGQHVLVRAMAILSKGRPAICLFAGDGDKSYRSELADLTRNLGLEQTIQWLGFVDDARALMRTCSVVVCPSYREPLGRVVFEAWDAGCVPVVFDGSGGAAEIVEASGGGVIYAEQTPESLAAALEFTLSMSEAEKNRKVAAGRTWMAINCDPSSYGPSVAAVLASAGGRV